jgi:hypothetical protein
MSVVSIFYLLVISHVRAIPQMIAVMIGVDYVGGNTANEVGYA